MRLTETLNFLQNYEMTSSDAPAETTTASHCQRRIAKLEAELKEECA